MTNQLSVNASTITGQDAEDYEIRIELPNVDFTGAGAIVPGSTSQTADENGLAQFNLEPNYSAKYLCSIFDTDGDQIAAQEFTMPSADANLKDLIINDQPDPERIPIYLDSDPSPTGTWDFTGATVTGIGDQTLTDTLSLGNATGGNDIAISVGDSILAYNSLVDASNFERLKVAWESNELIFGTESAGTGEARALSFETDSTIRMKPGSGVVEFHSILAPNATGLRSIGYDPLRFSRVVLGGNTVNASAPMIDLAQTWNNVAVEFEAIKVDITSSLSSSASKAISVTTNGLTTFNVNRLGEIQFGDGTFTTTLSPRNGSDTWTQIPAIQMRTSNAFIVEPGAGDDFMVRQASPTRATAIRWGTASNQTRAALFAPTTGDILEQYNGVNGQTYNLYGNRVDASNYERLALRHTGSGIFFDSEAAGTGTLVNMSFGLGGVSTMEVRLAELRIKNGSNLTADSTSSHIGTSANPFGNGVFSGSLTVGDGDIASLVLVSPTDATSGISFNGAEPTIRRQGNNHTVFSSQGIAIANDSYALILRNYGTFLYSDTDGELDIRNGASDQQVNIYGNHVDASNWERLQLEHTGSLAVIDSAASGTGAAADIQIRRGGSFRLGIYTSFISSSVNIRPTTSGIDFGITGTANRWHTGHFEHLDLNPAAPETDFAFRVIDRNNADHPFFQVGPVVGGGNSAMLKLGNSTTYYGSAARYLQIDSVWGSHYLQTWGGTLQWNLISGGMYHVNATGGLRTSSFFGFDPGNSTGVTRLYEDGDHQWAFRNGANPYTVFIYGNYVDASNYERLQIVHTGAAAVINSQAAGTGSVVDLHLRRSGADHVVLQSTATRFYYNVIPNANNGQDLGSVSNAWRDGHIAGTLTVGNLKTGTHTAVGGETISGYIEITDSGGVTRKLAVIS